MKRKKWLLFFQNNFLWLHLSASTPVHTVWLWLFQNNILGDIYLLLLIHDAYDPYSITPKSSVKSTFIHQSHDFRNLFRKMNFCRREEATFIISRFPPDPSFRSIFRKFPFSPPPLIFFFMVPYFQNFIFACLLDRLLIYLSNCI